MGYTPNLNDPSSPYYYGTDSTYKPQGRKPQPPKSRPVVELDFYGVPTVVKPGATAQPQQSSGNVTNVGGKSYNMDDPAQVKELNQVLADNQAALGNPTSADIRGGGGERSDGSGRHSVRTSPTGVVQSGTQMGPRPMTMDDANSLLNGGYTVSDPFSSNSLPASASSAYGANGYQSTPVDQIPENMFAVRPMTLGQNLDLDAGPFETGEVPENFVSGVELQSQMLRGSPNIAQGGAAETAASIHSATSTPKPSIPKRPRGERQAEMWDRKYGRQVNQPESTESTGQSFDMDRRRAFLDADSSLQGLRRVEAQKGVVYAGNTYNMVNPNRGQEGQNDFVQISKEDRDSYMRGDQGAQDLKAKYVDKITAANAGQDASAVTPADTAVDSPDEEDPDKSI